MFSSIQGRGWAGILAAVLKRLGSSWAVSRAAVDHLGTVLGRLGSLWGRPGAASERSWAVLRATQGVLRAFRPRLWTSWERLGSNSKENLDFRSVFDPNFDPRNLKNQAPATRRARFFKNRLWKVRLILYPILVPTWLYFGSFLVVLGGSGGILGRLGRVLARLRGFLGRLGPSWEPLGASWRRLAASWGAFGPSWELLELAWAVFKALWRPSPKFARNLSPDP